MASCPSKWAFVLFSSADTAAFPARDVCGCKDTPRHWLTLRPPSQDRLSKDSSLGLRDSGFCPCGLFVGDLGQGAAPGATKALWCLAPGDFPNFISRELRSPDHRITESQNGGGWKGPLWVTQPNLLLKQGHPEQAAQDCGQAGLEYLQRRRLHSLPGQPESFLLNGCHWPLKSSSPAAPRSRQVACLLFFFFFSPIRLWESCYKFLHCKSEELNESLVNRCTSMGVDVPFRAVLQKREIELTACRDRQGTPSAAFNHVKIFHYYSHPFHRWHSDSLSK